MKGDSIPKLPLKLLKWFCKNDLVDEIEGDLIEVYYERELTSPNKAKLKLYLEVLQSFNKRNIGIMENYQNTSLGNLYTMIRQFFNVLLRQMGKSKVYTGISIVSLSLALTCAGLIYLYLDKELNYDHIYENANSIFRINHHNKNSERTYSYAPLGMVPYLKENIPEVADGVRIFKYRRAIPIKVVDTQQSFHEGRFGWSDPSFFKLFDLKLIHGNPSTVLDRPDVVVISQSTARKYFGADNPIGKTVALSFGDDSPLEVAGVFEDFPTNTSFQFDIISNIETCNRLMWGGGSLTDWNNMYVAGFLKIAPQYAHKVEKEAQKAISTYFENDDPELWTTSLQMLTDIHLGQPMDIGEWNAHNDSQTIILFVVIGGIILCLGCFNFTNMVTAQASQRSQEVGIRKVLGSSRKLIALQTIFETFSFVIIAGVLSFLFMYGLLPWLSALTPHHYELKELFNLKFLQTFLLIALSVCIIAGIYPTLYISGLQSLQLMKKINRSNDGRLVRNVLVTAQFTITVGLIISTLMVYLQLQYLREKELGFDQSVIVNMPIHNDEAVIPKIPTFRNMATSNPGITHITAASHEMFSDYTYISYLDIDGFDDIFRWERYTVEQDYINTFELEMVAGRGFDVSIPSDSNAFVLNETAVKALGITPEEVLNRTISDTGLEKTGKIVGVVKDFHFRSLHHDIQPFVLYVNWDRLDYISARLSSSNFHENIDNLEKAWYDSFGEGIPFFFNFLDQQAADLYAREDNQSKLFTFFSLISVVLGAMGLFGFSLYTTERRFKEIGLRKVLGANVWELILMINRSSIKFLLVAFVIATPIAYVFINSWLAEFAYRIEQPLWVYLATGLMTFLLASLTVSYLSWKAASSNPVDAIRVE